jgi:hypothetical protein
MEGFSGGEVTEIGIQQMLVTTEETELAEKNNIFLFLRQLR